MDNQKIMEQMTLEEKAAMVTGYGSMDTMPVERFGVPSGTMADGPHGIRLEMDEREKNSTLFPGLCTLACSWDRNIAYRLGKALGRECRHHCKNMLLGPGVNIKRNILCGRNFEYLSEDPVLAGELAADYIKGLQEEGSSACLKHFAANNQETDRLQINVEIEERVLREIYLKVFEIAVRKGKPDAVMCAYNKLNAIWCSENPFLLDQILRKEWGFEGLMVSDWGAVHDAARAVMAGMDLIMPHRDTVFQEIREGLENGKVTREALDRAVLHVLEWVGKEGRVQDFTYDRNSQHEEAICIAMESMVLLKNENEMLPLCSDRHQKIAVVGGYARNPLRNGQGSAEVYPMEEYMDSPLDQLKRAMPDTEIRYLELYRKDVFSETMLWPRLGEFRAFAEECDVIVFFAGEMESESTEAFDRRSARLNPNQEFFIDAACELEKKVVVVLQSGGALILGEWRNRVDAIVQMWMGGEGAGTAIAQLLTGRVNPSGKLSETFPTKLRDDINCGDGRCVSYREGLEVGYRYYDRHPEEIVYPFGHGLSYTSFAYSDGEAEQSGDSFIVRFTLCNTGNRIGAEIIQVYTGQCSPTVTRPVKELKAFEKVYLEAGKKKKIEITIPISELGYYNTMLHTWVTEDGNYRILVGASSRDIRLKMNLFVKGNTPYSLYATGEASVG